MSAADENRLDAAPRRSWKPKAIAIACAVGVLVTAHHFGVFDDLSEPAKLTAALVDLGPWGYVAFVLTFALLQPFGIPGTVFVFGATLVWPWPIAFTLSMVGAMGATLTGFSFSRFVARDWVSRIIPPRFKKYEAALAKREFLTIWSLRSVFWTAPLLHAFLGVSRVRFSTHVWASFLGYFVPFLVMSYFGQKIFELLKGAPPSAWVAVIGAIVVALVLVFFGRRALAKRKLAAESP